MEDKREVSEFNNAIGYLNHINSLFIEASIHSKNLDVFNWANVLWSLFRVLSSEMKENELEMFRREKEIIKSKLFIYSRNKRQNYLRQVPEDIYNQLENFEIQLRKIYKISGLMNKKPEDGLNALR